MPVIRTKKRITPFVQIDSTSLSDHRLSWRAKGLLAYLLTKPDGWQVRSEDLIKHGTEGRDAIRAAMKELQEFGYARLVNTPNGREWEIYETPKPCPENPSLANEPSPENPCPEKANDWKSPPSNIGISVSNNKDSNTKDEFLEAMEEELASLKTLPKEPELPRAAKPPKPRFIKPTREEARAYAAKIAMSPEQLASWYDHFESNGWKISGKTPMVDWMAAMRNGKRMASKFSTNGSNGPARMGIGSA